MSCCDFHSLDRSSMSASPEKDNLPFCALGELFSIRNIEFVTGGIMSSVKMQLNSMTLILIFCCWTKVLVPPK